MLKTYKRITSILLSLCLLLSICIPVYASGSTTDAEIRSQMLRLLSSVKFEAEHYGLSGIDFGSVPLGQEIPTYHITDQGELTCADVRLFPIVSGSKVMSLFTVFNGPDGEIHTQLSSSLAEKINQNLISGEEFSIIYDDEGAYLYSREQLTLLGYSGQGAEHRRLISSLSSSALDSIETCAATQIYTLNVTEYMAGLPASQAVNPAIYLSVDKIKQPDGSAICWAAASASIINYIKGTHYTAQQVANRFGEKQGLAIHTVIFGLNDYYGLNYAYDNNGRIDEDLVFDLLTKGRPLYGDFWDLSSSHHAAVIRGINTLSEAFSVMDPTTGTYVLGTYSVPVPGWYFKAEYSDQTKDTWYLTGYGYDKG